MNVQCTAEYMVTSDEQSRMVLWRLNDIGDISAVAATQFRGYFRIRLRSDRIVSHNTDLNTVTCAPAIPTAGAPGPLWTRSLGSVEQLRQATPSVNAVVKGLQFDEEVAVVLAMQDVAIWVLDMRSGDSLRRVLMASIQNVLPSHMLSGRNEKILPARLQFSRFAVVVSCGPHLVCCRWQRDGVTDDAVVRVMTGCDSSGPAGHPPEHEAPIEYFTMDDTKVFSMAGVGDEQLRVWTLQDCRTITSFGGFFKWTPRFMVHKDVVISGSQMDTCEIFDFSE